ncbi:MAG: type II secretion system F family protein [Planctomycetota bacterium]
MPKKIQRKIQVARPQQAGAATSSSGGERKPLFQRGRVGAGPLTQFTTQLAILLEAGIPIVRSLQILENQMPQGALKRIVTGVRDDVEGGTPFSEALAKYPGVFDNLYTNMVRAGEAGGIQETILERLAGFMEKTEAIKSKVRGALAYPVAVMIIAALVITGVMVFVVPEFQTIFKQLIGKDLPPLTQSLIDLSDFIVQKWWIWLIILPLLFTTHVVLVARVLPYHRFRDRMRLRMPLFGGLIKKTLVARFARTFGTLIESGVPHIQALDIIKDSMRNLLVQDAVLSILASIREGEGIAQPMGQSDIFDEIIVNMVEVGEQTGELDRMLVRIADRYEVEVDRTIEVVFKALEPVIIVVLAVFVGYVVLALLQPMLKLMENLRG